MLTTHTVSAITSGSNDLLVVCVVTATGINSMYNIYTHNKYLHTIYAVTTIAMT